MYSGAVYPVGQDHPILDAALEPGEVMGEFGLIVEPEGIVVEDALALDALLAIGSLL